MKLELVAEIGCKGSVCPRIYRTDRNSYIVQGRRLDKDVKSRFSVPEDEDLVEIPEELMQMMISNKL